MPRVSEGRRREEVAKRFSDTMRTRERPGAAHVGAAVETAWLLWTHYVPRVNVNLRSLFPLREGARGRAAPSDTMSLAAQLARWLVERRGGGEDGGFLLHPQALAEEIIALGDEGEWGPDDIVTSRDAIESRRGTWEAIVDEAAARLASKTPAVRISKIQMKRAVAWALLPSRVTASGPDPAEEKAADEAEKSEAKIETKSKLEVSADAKKDMEKQGAARVEQLLQFSVSMEIGRKATLQEIGGASYAGHLSSVTFLQKASKLKHVKLATDLCREAVASGSILELDRHNQKLIKSVMADTTDAFFMSAGAKFASAWQKAKDLGRRDPRLAAMYWCYFTEEYQCRGMPEVYDDTVMNLARLAIEELDESTELATLKKTGGGGSSTGSPSVASYPSSAAGSDSGSAILDAIKGLSSDISTVTTEMSSLKAAVSDVREEARRASAKVADVANQVKQLKSNRREPGAKDDSDKGKAVCFVCGKPGHMARDCPLVKAAKDGEEE